LTLVAPFPFLEKKSSPTFYRIAAIINPKEKKKKKKALSEGQDFVDARFST
jgi:hypothetical protein